MMRVARCWGESVFRENPEIKEKIFPAILKWQTKSRLSLTVPLGWRFGGVNMSQEKGGMHD
jgi:hypothetical protein